MVTDISKFELDLVDSQVILVPQYAKILSAIEQWNEIHLCVLKNDTKQPMVPITVRIVKTNEDFKNSEWFMFLNTVKLNEGNTTFHVFYMRGELE